MPSFGRGSGADSDRPGDGESLDAIARSEQLLDALAGQYREQPVDRGEAELLALLEGWRDGVRRPTADHVVSEYEAAAALRQGLEQRPVGANKGARRHLALVGSVAAAVLCIGGFGGVVAGAGPGDSLYGMRTALFGEPQGVRDDRVALAAQTEMAEVQRLIDQGDWDQAQQKLETLTTSVADVEDVTRKQELVDEWNQLSVKVETRDPAATLPPPEPGDPLLTLPAPVSDTATSSSETTSTSSETTSSETTSTETTSTETTSPSGETSPSETSTETTSPSEPTPTSSSEAAPAPSTTPSPSSSPSPTTSVTPSTTSTAAPSTTSTTPPTTTTRSATSVTTTTTTTTTVPRADGPTSAPAQVVPSSALVEAETEAVPTAEEAPSVQEMPSSALPTTTTTEAGPVIQLPIPGLN